MAYGRPLMVSNSVAKIGLPRMIDDTFLSDTPDIYTEQPGTLPSYVEPFVQLIKLYDILGKILEHEGSGHNASGDQEHSGTKKIDTKPILALDGLLTEWRDSLPRYLRYDLDTKECVTIDTDDPSAESRVELDLRKQAKRLYQR